MKPASNDLGSLIGAAAAEANHARLQAAAEPAPRPAIYRYVRLGGAAIALAFAATQLAHLFHFHSAAQTAEDLDAIVEQARQGVEAARVAQGRLPDALPNAALAGLVAYTPVGNNYQLFAASGGVSVTLEPDGAKTVKKGSAP